MSGCDHCQNVGVMLELCREELERTKSERDKARAEVEWLQKAAQAVVDRWETPGGKDAEPTANVIGRLREQMKAGVK